MRKRLGVITAASIAALGCALGAAGTAIADQGTWQTATFVGPSEVDVTLGIDCPALSFVCSLIDGYGDTQTATLIGSGTVDIDTGSAEIRFETDGTQDVGSGDQPAFLTMSGTPLVFTPIPFAGVPEITNLLVFALTDPPIPVPTLAFQPPGDHPFTTTLDYASISDVVGDLEFMMDDIVVPAQPVAVTGTVRVLGDVDVDGHYEYEIIDWTASLTLQIAGHIGGEPVTLTVTTDLVAHLAGEVPGAPPPVPTVGVWARSILALLLMTGATAIAMRRRTTTG